MTNIGSLDRIVRILVAVVLFELAYFWLAGAWQIAVAAVGVVVLATGVFRFCLLYRLSGVTTQRSGAKGVGRARLAIAAVLLIALAVGGSIASGFVTRRIFLEDFNAMNNFYKQALFFTGKSDRGRSIDNYERLVPVWQQFWQKYTAYRPHALKGDAQFAGDLARVGAMIAEAEPLVRSGDLQQAHLDLEKIRPVFQEIFRRNAFSLLSVALVDFHDAMELMLEAAGARSAERLVVLYPQVSEKMKAVEVEASDAEIQAIRRALDDLHQAARESRPDLLAGRADALKSAFVKVYLKRG